MLQTQNNGMHVCDYIKDMQHEDEVCIKGNESNKGFNARVNALNQCVAKVLSAHPNSRGSITLVLEEADFKKVAKQHGYNI